MAIKRAEFRRVGHAIPIFTPAKLNSLKKRFTLIMKLFYYFSLNLSVGFNVIF